MKVDTVSCFCGRCAQKTVDIIPKKASPVKYENPAKAVDVLPAAGIMGAGLALWYMVKCGTFNKCLNNKNLKHISRII